MGSVGRTLAMPTAGASWIQECGAVAASLSLSSLFPHSGSKSSSETENMTSSSYPRPGTLPASMTASAPASQHPEAGNLATIMEDADSGTGSSDKENTAASSVQPEHSVEEYERASAISARKEEAKTRRRKKKKTANCWTTSKQGSSSRSRRLPTSSVTWLVLSSFSTPRESLIVISSQRTCCVCTEIGSPRSSSVTLTWAPLLGSTPEAALSQRLF